MDHAPQALPVVLKCADWSKRHQVQGVYALLHIWRPLVPEVALQLLDASQPDPRVRAFAINCLEEALSDKQLSIYLLQLVQAMKGEMYHDSALARFLIRRGLSSISAVGLPLYWSITSELVDSVCSYRFGIFLQNFLKVCGTTNRQRFGHQAFITKRLSFVQEIVKAVNPMQNFCPWVLGKPYFQSPKTIAGNKLQDVTFRNHLVARCDIEN